MLRRRERVIKCFFTKLLVWPRPITRNPAPGLKIYNFGGAFLGHHFYIFSLSDICLKIEEKKL